jgi:hypothetical protein
MTSKFLTLTLAVALILLIPIVAPAQSEPRGYTCHDCPYYKGEFSITNNTSVTIRYSYRWGTKSTWETSSLRPGVTDTHSYPLGYKPNNTAPPPYISIDRIAGDNYSTNRTIAIDFYAVRYGGYGPPRPNRTAPKRYEFRITGRVLKVYEM